MNICFLNAFDDEGMVIHPEVCEKLFDCTARLNEITLPETEKEKLMTDARIHSDATLNDVMERNNSFYQEECERLFRWADDLMLSAKRNSKTPNQLRELNRQLRLASTNRSAWMWN